MQDRPSSEGTARRTTQTDETPPRVTIQPSAALQRQATQRVQKETRARTTIAPAQQIVVPYEWFERTPLHAIPNERQAGPRQRVLVLCTFLATLLAIGDAETCLRRN